MQKARKMSIDSHTYIWVRGWLKSWIRDLMFCTVALRQKEPFKQAKKRRQQAFNPSGSPFLLHIIHNCLERDIEVTPPLLDS